MTRDLDPIELVVTVTLALVSSIVSYPMIGLAQTVPSTHNDSQDLRIRFQQQDSDGSSRGRPGRREGTGSRGDCPSVETPLTALIPSSHIGSFVEAYPTLWFYNPYQSGEVTWAEFSLQDEQNQDIYRANLTLPSLPGIVSLNLSSLPPFPLDKPYQWYIKIYCDRAKLSTPIFIRGWVKRIPLKPDLEKQLRASQTPRHQIAIYAQNGIWYSALTTLMNLRLAEPQNPSFQDDSTHLLGEIGLENLSQKKLAGMVKIQDR